MKERACIYCGTTEDLSKSDIIPDALTNAKIINPNVCRIDHNSRFSDMFEDEIIKGLAFITNELDIKSSKGKKYASYTARFKIKEKKFITKLSSDMEVFSGGKIISTEDGKTKLGPLDKIRKFKKAADKNIETVDLGENETEKEVVIDMSIFFGAAMHRLMAKIAYEWYCLHNSITGKLDDFDSIIEFITTGTGPDPVQLVGNQKVYEWFEALSDLGSHTILSYIGCDDSVNIIVSLFGIAIYNIRLLPHPIDRCKNNAVFQNATTYAKKVGFSFPTLTELMKYLHEASHVTNLPNYGMILTPKDREDTAFKYKIGYANFYRMLQKDLMCVTQLTPQAEVLLERQIDHVLQTSMLTVRSLKRFAKEHQQIFNIGKGLNPKGGDRKSTFLFYILFVIGELGDACQGLKDLNIFLQRRFYTAPGEPINISDELIDELFHEMLGTEDHFEKIKLGAAAVEKWEFE